MPKKSSTQESLALAFEILKRIPTSHKITAKELHLQLHQVGIERDLRTIQRSLGMLCEHFEVIRDERSKPYGYKWNKKSTGMTLLKLSTQEALLLSLAEQYLIKLLPANITASLNDFFQEAKNSLRSTNSNSKDKEWLKKVKVASENQPLLPPRICSEIFSSISEALYQNRLLSIDYYNVKQESKSAFVMPLGIVQQAQRLYLVCRFEGYNNERSVAIHRVTKAIVSTFSFERPKEFNLSQYDADGRFGFGEGVQHHLTFKITKQAGFHLTETPLSHDQQIILEGDMYQVSATVTQSKQLERWLSGFEEQIFDIEFNEIKS
ncbi:helix-turn-helix transcriptional regulator [Shewanella sp. 125m-1]